MSKSTRGFVSTVSDWWSKARVVRDIFPWRRARDPWLVLVSEVMLTQSPRTLTCRGPIRTFHRSVPHSKEFRDHRIVVATESVVRSRLQPSSEVAARIRSDNRLRVFWPSACGRCRSRIARWGRALRSRAVAAFAYDKHVAPIDSNVRRVLERSIAGKPIPMTHAQEIGDALIPRGRSRDWGLALMDFGSLVCSARNPKCAECPVRLSNRCAWRAAIDRQSDDSPDPRTQVRRLGEPFAGSRRDIRGRLLRSACHAPIAPDALVKFAGTESEVDRVREIATRLVEEGLLFRHPMSARSQAAMPSRWLQAVGSS